MKVLITVFSFLICSGIFAVSGSKLKEKPHALLVATVSNVKDTIPKQYAEHTSKQIKRMKIAAVFFAAAAIASWIAFPVIGGALLFVINFLLGVAGAYFMETGKEVNSRFLQIAGKFLIASLLAVCVVGVISLFYFTFIG